MSRFVTQLLRPAALASLLLVLAGCGGGQGDLDQWLAQEKAKKGGPLDPLPVIKTFETFEYKAQDLRDPFGASRQEQEEMAAADAGPRPDQNRQKEELERYPLDGLKMMGTLGTGANMEGLVKEGRRVYRMTSQGLSVAPSRGGNSGAPMLGLLTRPTPAPRRAR